MMRMAVIFLILSIGADPSMAAGDVPSFAVEIRGAGFSPAEVRIPAGMRVKLVVRNGRSLPSEFESFELNREKVVPPGASVTVWIGPLDAGRYKIFDDFNPSVTGWIVAEPTAQAGP